MSKQMREMQLSDLRSQESWMDFIRNIKVVHIPSHDIALNIFGDGEQSHLVINVYNGDNKSTEYVFIAPDSSNKVALLVTALRTVDYSLETLLAHLGSAAYETSEVGDYHQLGELKVFKSEVTSN